MAMPAHAAAGSTTRSDPAAGPQTIVVLDFGGQYAQLIARRIRELNVYSVLLPHDTPWDVIAERHPVGRDPP